MQIHSAQRFSLNIHIFLVLVMVAERPPVASCTTSHQLSHPIVLGSPQQASKRVLEGLKDNKAFGRTASLGKTGQDITTSVSVGCKDFVKSQAKLWKNVGGSKLDLQQINYSVKTKLKKKIKEGKKENRSPISLTRMHMQCT